MSKDEELIGKLVQVMLGLAAEHNSRIAGAEYHPDNWDEYDYMRADENARAILPFIHAAERETVQKIVSGRRLIGPSPMQPTLPTPSKQGSGSDDQRRNRSQGAGAGE